MIGHYSVAQIHELVAALESIMGENGRGTKRFRCCGWKQAITG